MNAPDTATTATAQDSSNLRDFVVAPLATAVAMNVSAAVRTRRQGYSVLTGAEITDYDPMDPIVAAQPHDAYRRLHAGGRVHYNPKRSTWILHRFEDVRAAAKDSERITVSEGVTRMRFSLPLLIFTDGDKHTRMRKQVFPAFTRAALESWQPLVDTLAHDLVAEAIGKPEVDIVQALGIPMPTRVIATLLGIPDADIHRFRDWSENAIKLLDFTPSPAGVTASLHSIRAVLALRKYFMRQFASGKLKGSESVLGRLLAGNADGSVSDAELFWFALLLLLAGNETTTNLIDGMVDTYARHPDQFDAIRADPSLIPAAVEEQLRYTSPIQGLYRTASADYEIGNATIPAGARLLLLFGAANRDPEVFESPDEFRHDRNPRQHLGFGYGRHMCVGAALARMEAQAVLRELASQVSRIEPTGTARWSANSSLRGPSRLPVRLVR